MNFLGVGPAEIVVIFVIALVVFGPKRLPEVGRTLGRAVREFRSVSEELTSQLREELETASEEVEAVSTDVKSTLEAASEDIQLVAGDLKGTLQAASEDIQLVAGDLKGTVEAASEDMQLVAGDLKGTLETASKEVQSASEEARSELAEFNPIQSAIDDVTVTLEEEPISDRDS